MTLRRSENRSLDLGRLLRSAILALVVAAGTGALYHNLAGPDAAYDLRGVLDAARAMLHGANPYVGNSVHALLTKNNPYVLPPLIGEATIPLSALPFAGAVIVFDGACVAAMIAALWLIGVRDFWIYVITLFSLPFVDSLWLGQPDGLFALALALAWRYREQRPAPIAVACVVAAKLLTWPLLLWLALRARALTRRFAAAALAALAAAALLAGSWALIDLRGLRGYPHRLALDARAFGARSHSIAALAIRLGAGTSAGEILGIATTAVIVLALAWIAGISDLGIFATAILAGLLLSPLLWTHYLTVLFVPLAVARPKLDRAWLCSAAFYLSPAEPVAHAWQIALVLVIAVGLAYAAIRTG